MSGWLWVVLALTVATRLYGITSPLTDGGQERQALVAMTARNLLRDNLNILYPRVDTFAFSPGYFMLEFPLQAWLMALIYKVTGVHDAVGRLLSLVFSSASVLPFFGISRRVVGDRYALISCVIYALTPLSIFFGRAVHPEPVFLFFATGGLYCMLRWWEQKPGQDHAITPKQEHPARSGGSWRWFGLACVAEALAVLVKAPPGLVLLLPLASLWWLRHRQGVLRWPPAYLFVIGVGVPITLWALWGRAVGVDTEAGWSPYRLSALERWGVPAFWFHPVFYTFVARSVVSVALTPIGAVLALHGVWALRHRRLALFGYAWLIATLIYVVLTPGAQATHWNYHVPIIPIGALLAGASLRHMGDTGLLARLGGLAQRFRLVAGTVVAAAAIGYAALYAVAFDRAYDTHLRVPNALEVGEIVKHELRSDGFVFLIQPNMVGELQSYYMDRKVHLAYGVQPFKDQQQAAEWTTGMRSMGAVGIVAVDTAVGSGVAALNGSPQLVSHLRASARLVAEAPGYIIFAFD